VCNLSKVRKNIIKKNNTAENHAIFLKLLLAKEWMSNVKHYDDFLSFLNKV